MERVLKTYVQLVYAFMYLPVAVVALFSFNSAEMLAFPITGFTLAWYDVAIHDSRLLGGLANSILIAAPAADDLDHARRHGGPCAYASSLPR